MKKFTMVVGFWAVGWATVACSDSSGGEELDDPAGGNSGTSGQATGGYSGVATTGGTSGAGPSGGFSGTTGGAGGTGVTGGSSGTGGAGGRGGAGGSGGASSSGGGAGGMPGGKMGKGDAAGSAGVGGAQAGRGGGGVGGGNGGMSGSGGANGGSGNGCPADEPRMMCSTPGISCDYGDRLCRCNAMTNSWNCFDKADNCPATPDPGGDCMGGSACSYVNDGLCVCTMRKWVCD